MPDLTKTQQRYVDVAARPEIVSAAAVGRELGRSPGAASEIMRLPAVATEVARRRQLTRDKATGLLGAAEKAAEKLATAWSNLDPAALTNPETLAGMTRAHGELVEKTIRLRSLGYGVEPTGSAQRAQRQRRRLIRLAFSVASGTRILGFVPKLATTSAGK